MIASSYKLEMPGLRLGPSPEKTVATRADMMSGYARLDRQISSLFSSLGRKALSQKAFEKTDLRIRSYLQYYRSLSATEFSRVATSIRQRSRQFAGIDTDQDAQQLLQEQIAFVCLLTERCLGLRPRKEQRYACWLMRQGLVVEMQTGEGKTLCSALTAAVVGLNGVPVHIMTVNDYLVERDASQFEKFYRAVGLSSAAVLSQQDEIQRRGAYKADIVYGTAKQITFDYLRDGVNAPNTGSNGRLSAQLNPLLSSAGNPPLLRGLCFAILDEIDSILIDEARTPLVIATEGKVPSSHQGETSEQTKIAIALGIARLLHTDVDFIVSRESRSVQLTETGMQALQQFSAKFEGVWRYEKYRNERVRQALQALHVFKAEKDYIVKNGKIQLIDESTGRVMPDQRLQNGLHQFIEVRERCAVTAEHNTQASISYHAFFNRYRCLSGMSGTVKEILSELRDVYALSVVQVPTHKPSQRQHCNTRMFQTKLLQNDAILESVKEVLGSKRSVLLGTRSVSESDRISTVLSRAGIEHQILNARQDEEEAAIVAAAGQMGTVTVATNMAGRGTDIPLDDTVMEHGGLHVVSLALNDSGRIDRQLFGRCARQGDAGSTETILSLDDELLAECIPSKLISVLKSSKTKNILGDTIFQVIGGLVSCFAQLLISRHYTSVRYSIYRSTDHINRYLAFGGKRD